MSVHALHSVAIIGAGALGSYYGTRLAWAGRDVKFLMRRDLEHVRAHGIEISENGEQRRLSPVSAYGTTNEIGPVDLVLVALKSTANEALPELLPPLLHADTTVVTLQNGLGNEEYLASLVGGHRVMGGLCFIAVTRPEPGRLQGFHTPGALTVGEFGRPASDRTRAVAACFTDAGVRCRAVDNLEEERWRKLVWNIPFNGLSIAAGGISTDRILASPELAAEVRALMDEIATAAGRLGLSIPESFIQKQIDVTGPMGAYQPSSLVDYLAGRAVEVEPIWGEPLRRAAQQEIEMPRLTVLYSLIKHLVAAKAGMAESGT